MTVAALAGQGGNGSGHRAPSREGDRMFVSLLLASILIFSRFLQSQVIAEGTDLQFRHSIPDQFRAVDTSRLMGHPDPLPLHAVPAFKNLKWQRPVELTFAPDGSNRLFVVAQQGG